MLTTNHSRQIASLLGAIPSGLFVVTIRKGIERGAFLASWVQQSSFQPPMLTICMGKDRPIGVWFKHNALFGVHVLSEHHKKLLKHFANPPLLPDQTFNGLRTHPSIRGVPVLTESLGMLECKTIQTISTGDHDLVIGEVIDALEFETGKPRVHIRKSGFQY